MRRDRLVRILQRMLDPDEFLSPHGIRSSSKYHAAHPCELQVNGSTYTVRYEPAESRTGTFGGNSSWRGPVGFPVNYLLVEALHEFHDYYGDELQVEYPTGSGAQRTLAAVADDLANRLAAIFLRGQDGRRPAFGDNAQLQTDPHWWDLLAFNEYFHGDTGAGLGASHQTGWTALVALLLEGMAARRRASPPRPSPPLSGERERG